MPPYITLSETKIQLGVWGWESQIIYLTDMEKEHASGLGNTGRITENLSCKQCGTIIRSFYQSDSNRYCSKCSSENKRTSVLSMRKILQNKGVDTSKFIERCEFENAFEKLSESKTPPEDLRNNLINVAGEVLELIEDVKRSVEGIVDLPFPQVVVIGDEGHGKSSLLERLASLELFPIRKGDKEGLHSPLKARMPIKLVMKYMKGDDFEKFCKKEKLIFEPANAVAARVTYHDKDSGKTQGLEYIIGFSGIAELIESNMIKLVKSKSSSGTFSGIVKDEFTIEVVSPVVPNLTLVDLPGIVAATLPGEPRTLPEDTENLVLEFLDKPHTLFLLVCRANLRLRGCRALKLLQDRRKEDLVLCVLTYCDDSGRAGYEDPWFELRNRVRGRSEDSIPLPHGYVGVVNRNNRLDKVPSLKESSQIEREWFQKHTPELLKEGSVTIGVVINKVTQMMLSYVSKTWSADTKNKVNIKITAINAKLEALGAPVTLKNTPQLLKDLASMVCRVWTDIQNTCKMTTLLDPISKVSLPTEYATEYYKALARQNFVSSLSSTTEDTLKLAQKEISATFLLQLSTNTSLPLNVRRFKELHIQVNQFVQNNLSSLPLLKMWRDAFSVLKVQYFAGLLSEYKLLGAAQTLASQTFFESLWKSSFTTNKVETYFDSLDTSTLLRESETVRKERERLLNTKRTLVNVLSQIDKLSSFANK